MKSILRTSLSAFLFLLLWSCATKQVYIKDTGTGSDESFEAKGDLSHEIFLIGDAGNADPGESLKAMNGLIPRLNASGKNATALFLGDNIYEKGMPPKNHPERALAEHRIDAQLELISDFPGKTIFIPGNHDYYSNGIEGLKRQENYITGKLDDKDAFLPRKGCPMKKIDLDDKTLLLIVDSQWYLENWDDNPTMNDDCDIKNRTVFFREFESEIKKNSARNIIIAMHHPLYTDGPHGGQFSFASQFTPVGSFPLPVLGSLVNLLRKTGGLSPQDLQHPKYREFRDRIVTILQRGQRVAVVAGHEHSLQYLIKDGIRQIVSGSGSKSSAVRPTSSSSFAYGNHGYASIQVRTDGSASLAFYSAEPEEHTLLYSTELFEPFEPFEPNITDTYPTDFPETMSASVYTAEEVRKSGFYRMLWGDHYRKYYGIEIEAPTVNLDTLLGGLTPMRKGGGNQSRSLRLKDPLGREYVMRALKKSATQYIQAIAYKDQYVEGMYDDTVAEALLLDIFTTAHPYAPFTIAPLAKAIGVYHTDPQLYYIPKQPALKHFNEEFGNELYMIEERADSGHGDKPGFGFSDELISTDDLFKNLRKSDDYVLEESLYIRSRLFDMLIGDWDRHEDQWRWAEFREGEKRLYRPVPRDRDQAFSNSDGMTLGLITRLIPALKLMQTYTPGMRSEKWFNLEPYPLDMALLQNSSWDDWQNEVRHIKKHLDESVIAKAFSKMPEEVQGSTTDDMKSTLSKRLDRLHEFALNYYQVLSRIGLVLGDDKDNRIVLERKADGITEASVYNIKDGETGSLISRRSFSRNQTKEIWVYGLDDTDIIEVIGANNPVIPIRIVGGQNNDTYEIQSKPRVTIYDFKSKKNTLETPKAKHRYTDDYEQNIFDHKKLRYNQNLFLPAIGSNPDDGLRIGFTNLYTVYGFERNPFSQQHQISMAYYNSTRGYDLSYTGEFAGFARNWNLLVSARYTSPNYSINHYGFGNSTVNLEDEFDKDYHRVRLQTSAAGLAIKKAGDYGGLMEFGGSVERIKVESTSERFISTLPYADGVADSYVGLYTLFQFENFDYKAFPTMGLSTEVELGWKQHLDDAGIHHSYLKPSMAMNYRLGNSGNLVLATKLAGHIIFGDGFEFYNGASIGGLEGLRGYRNQRFTGKRAFYQKTDLRLLLKRVRTGLFPMQMGIFGGYDHGRVWMPGEDSDDWKSSYGGGLWFVAAEMINVNTSVFKSSDGYYVNFGLGFGF